jgi:pimeloyl-ACP methyl ester carboxylesterase
MEQSLERPDGRIAYREWRPEGAAATEALPVVLVHGVTSNALSWVRVGAALGRTRRTIALDQRGHGDSHRPARGYRHAEAAEDVAALCRELGLRRVALVGHSWGGAVGVALAATSDLIERLVLEDPVLYLPPETRTKYAEDFAATVGLTPDQARVRFNAGTVPPTWTDEDLGGKVDAAVKGSPDAVRAVFHENDPWDLRAELAALRVPTLMLNAARERGGFVHPDVETVAHANPAVRVTVIPEADHNVHRTAFDPFMHELTTFLEARG